MDFNKNLEKNLIDAFKNGDITDFIENLYFLIKTIFKKRVQFIKSLLNYEDELEVVNEIIVQFLDKKFNSIKLRFKNMKELNSQEFFSIILLGLSHTIIEILENDETYKIKQRLRKEILKSLNNSKYFHIHTKGNTSFITKKANKETEKPDKKPENLLGISGKDIEAVLLIVTKSNDKEPLHIIINKCYEFLKINGYIVISDYNLNHNQNIENDIYSKEISKIVLNELKKILTDREIEIFYLYFVKEEKIKNIARKMQISEQLVNYYKNKSIKATQKIVKNFKGDMDKEVIKQVLERLDENFKK